MKRALAAIAIASVLAGVAGCGSSSAPQADPTIQVQVLGAQTIMTGWCAQISDGDALRQANTAFRVEADVLANAMRTAPNDVLVTKDGEQGTVADAVKRTYAAVCSEAQAALRRAGITVSG